MINISATFVDREATLRSLFYKRAVTIEVFL
jgi:hypothetical protein